VCVTDKLFFGRINAGYVRRVLTHERILSEPERRRSKMGRGTKWEEARPFSARGTAVTGPYGAAGEIRERSGAKGLECFVAREVELWFPGMDIGMHRR
jgi:hypothetical protein